MRFSGFDDEWIEEKLGNLVQIKSGECTKNLITGIDNSIPYFKVEQLNNSLKYQIKTPYFINDKSKIVNKGSIIFPKRGAAILLNKIRILNQDSFMDTNLMTLTPNNKLYNEFLYYFIYKENLSKIADTTSIPQLNNKHIKPYPIKLPSFEEQLKISKFISSVDKKVSLLSQNLEIFNDFKKGLLQQIFTQKLRFENYNEAIYKLSDLYSSKKGTGLSKDKLDEEGLNKCILYGELYTTYNEIIQDVKSKTNSQEGILSKVGDILIPSSTTTKGIDLVTASVILEENVLLSGDITILRSKNENIINNKFFAYYFTNNLVKDVSKLTQGSTIIHLYWKDFKKVKLALPPINEQNKCVDLFLKLDKKIDLINFQIQKMEEFKKGLLQQMFVCWRNLMKKLMEFQIKLCK